MHYIVIIIMVKLKLAEWNSLKLQAFEIPEFTIYYLLCN